jgi:hypothetical protein
MPAVASAADGLPPIESIDQAIAGLSPQPLVGCSYSFLPCPECGGESASEQDIQMIARRQPHWYGASRCRCEGEDDRASWDAYVNNVIERWNKEKKK